MTWRIPVYEQPRDYWGITNLAPSFRLLSRVVWFLVAEGIVLVENLGAALATCLCSQITLVREGEITETSVLFYFMLGLRKWFHKALYFDMLRIWPDGEWKTSAIFSWCLSPATSFLSSPEAIHRNHNSFLTQNIEIMGWGDDSVVKNIPSLSEDALSILAHTLGALNHL